MDLFSAHFFFNGSEIIKMNIKENFYYINYDKKLSYQLLCNTTKQIELANLIFYNGIILLNKNENFNSHELIKQYFMSHKNDGISFVNLLKEISQLFLSKNFNSNYNGFLLLENINLSNFKYNNNLIIKTIK